MEKSIPDLPARVRDALVALIRDIEAEGPVRGNWPNYSKLGHRQHHCHLKKGCPTYVAVWEEVEAEIRLVEITADDDLPGTALRGARAKEGLTQVELSELTGIPQRHISEIENGKRRIGKERAAKLAQALNVSYRIFI